jgi:hypothetical protein
MNGTEQRRTFRIEGKRPFLETAPQPHPNDPSKTFIGRVVWEREE